MVKFLAQESCTNAEKTVVVGQDPEEVEKLQARNFCSDLDHIRHFVINCVNILQYAVGNEFF